MDSREKFRYMVGMSDKLPVTLIPVSVPCQQKPDCMNMTSQVMWQMFANVWYLMPTCATCITESGHSPLEPNRCAYCQMEECICDDSKYEQALEHENDLTPEERAAECKVLHPGEPCSLPDPGSYSHGLHKAGPYMLLGE